MAVPKTQKRKNGIRKKRESAEKLIFFQNHLKIILMTKIIIKLIIYILGTIKIRLRKK